MPQLHCERDERQVTPEISELVHYRSGTCSESPVSGAAEQHDRDEMNGRLGPEALRGATGDGPLGVSAPCA